jgi:hypothetical protein
MSIMPSMRRMKFILAAPPAILALLAAPLFHTHLGMAGDSVLFAQEHPSAVHHAHFPGEPGHSGPERRGHADLDHSSSDTKSFVLLTDTSAPSFRDPGLSMEAPRVYAELSLVLIERIGPAVAPAIHDPPGRGSASLRAPPTTPSI